MVSPFVASKRLMALTLGLRAATFLGPKMITSRTRGSLQAHGEYLWRMVVILPYADNLQLGLQNVRRHEVQIPLDDGLSGPGS